MIPLINNGFGKSEPIVKTCLPKMTVMTVMTVMIMMTNNTKNKNVAIDLRILYIKRGEIQSLELHQKKVANVLSTILIKIKLFLQYKMV